MSDQEPVTDEDLLAAAARLDASSDKVDEATAKLRALRLKARATRAAWLEVLAHVEDFAAKALAGAALTAMDKAIERL